MQEFIYHDKLGLDIPLEDIVYRIENVDDESCLISNSNEVETACYAPEIDFYLQNSQDSILTKAKNTSLLYEARAISFDKAKALDYEQEVGKNIIVIGEGLEELIEKLKDEKMAVLSLEASQVVSVKGHLGSLHVSLIQNDEEVEVDTDQMIWKNAPEFALVQSGVINVEDESVEEILAKAKEKRGNYQYKNYIFYDSSICQYHERREEICAKCAEVCPTVAIVKEDAEKHLKFSHIDCMGCGGCISVCPSGALDYSQMPAPAFYEVAKLYKNKIPLIIPRKMFDESISVDLPENVLPLAIEGEKYLHESHLLSLLQESGSQVIFYTDFVSKGSKDVISILNQAYRAKYQKDGILVPMDVQELKSALENVSLIPDSYNSIYEGHLFKREIFAKRLQFLVGEENLGVVKSGEHVRYGDVKINESNCTLCLSCVAACNVGALSANSDDNSLRLNPSICTTCGYCEATCPEKDCIEVVRGEILLEKSWFESRIAAQDTLFECVSCNKPFATTKSVMKIVSMMEPIFMGDEAKIKSLYCCADCKPKVMFETFLAQNEV